MLRYSMLHNSKWMARMCAVGVPLVWLAGCAHHQTADKMDPHASQWSAESAGAGSFDTFRGEDISAEAKSDIASGRVYYFDFDRDAVRPEFVAKISQQAQYLVQHPHLKVRVEGHCDERGSREYNIGLAERRAQAVVRILTVNGVARDRIAVVSYGKERPAVQGHDESAWKWNRRAKIAYESNDGAVS